MQPIDMRVHDVKFFDSLRIASSRAVHATAGSATGRLSRRARGRDADVSLSASDGLKPGAGFALNSQ